ncbi:gfo/Idh/MocA family oxidoreductase [Aquibacillus halophilus]|uniref:Gfo/Idh/MocA family oxidoreductase n=1 Tax=Aquibacillus halophilus TaxID=930132 RepID=A0A6A8DKC3_9BACI|nr:Gfo/Idh/MocA family oxidoreductase [Aquibacillus halophilus]MRH44926.1 gfo/Idh/MocA family oxidoreductase [Aquibacillus halophilus]
MEKKIRIGVVGLGGIAQKAYLPILSRAVEWELIGAFSPGVEKRNRICKQYRMNSFSSLASLADECDAAFVHSSTETHYEVVSYLLENGVDVYVDKPLASTLEEAEKLAELSDKNNRKLMVGFNRRFAPMYLRAKKLVGDFDWVHMEKHRTASVGPQDYAFTMRDDYLHLVDTIRWIANEDVAISDSFIKKNNEHNLVYAKHNYKGEQRLFTSAMHRQAGSNIEKLEFVTNNSIVRVLNLGTLEVESDQTVSTSLSNSWDTILKIRGFEDCVYHFITSIHNDQKPAVDGWEAVKSQQLLERLIATMN